LLVLESPGGVGFSYCAANLHGGNCNNTDDSTARAARAAVQDFFARKFPGLRQNPFFITGESYAGVYIPTLASEILENAPEINLHGIAVGDPCTDMDSQKDAMNMLWYAHKNSLVPDGDFDFLWNNCSYGGSHRPSFLSWGHWRRDELGWAAPPTQRSPMPNADLEEKCNVSYRRFMATTSRGISQGWPHAYLNELSFYADAAALDWSLPGTLNGNLANYMNRKDVRQALHVQDAPTQSWPGPAPGWSYTSLYNACNSGQVAPGTPSMVDFYRKIAPRLRTTIVFNGDTDPCVSYEGTRRAIEKVGFPVVKGGEYRPWFFHKAAADLKTFQEKDSLVFPDLDLRDAGAQFGGQVVSYAHNLSFATIHGAGHMVPQYRPQAASRLLSSLLSGGLLSPLLPSDEEIAGMSEDEFNGLVDTWTQVAKDMVVPKAKRAMDPLVV
jgi:cathepsin A (carboxypeptidase C)